MGRNNVAFIVIGASALAIGIALKLFVGRRRFYRRNQAGLQRFKNYRWALFKFFFEKIFSIIGGWLITLGVICLAIAVFVGK